MSKNITITFCVNYVTYYGQNIIITLISNESEDSHVMEWTEGHNWIFKYTIPHPQELKWFYSVTDNLQAPLQEQLSSPRTCYFIQDTLSNDSWGIQYTETESLLKNSFVLDPLITALSKFTSLQISSVVFDSDIHKIENIFEVSKYKKNIILLVVCDNQKIFGLFASEEQQDEKCFKAIGNNSFFFWLFPIQRKVDNKKHFIEFKNDDTVILKNCCVDVDKDNQQDVITDEYKANRVLLLQLM
ncbi:hypothetical protein EIN_467730 [Entamoeba invadens IP1]|uniref:Uncharacterized protein n=1 Tax=Entamoeba invadens IP1 TaxID=370355 RepID=A0A0A1TUH5_ENTIV|nr:hypothetical protein EIN_467730 [Entamoeba invadens IP1]ELP83669.1 hypothetical protein EIN_467730 [Entamoeba invadens IP1]|eukprot:XP_004183015.1 hypothetical protein EIN_467730 [Entamoeba invadens IP1]